MEFRLFAPHNERVDLIGSWDDGQARAMTRGDDGTWRVDAEVPDGRHTYRFRLPSLSPFMSGETVEISDPKARLIDDWAGEASVIVVEGGEDVTVVPGFAWQHDDVPLPADERLVIYELHVGEFGWHGDQQGTFLSVIDRLDYLRDLGVNAVELMPVMAFPGSESWGYNVRYPFSLEASYGTPEDFKRLVDECHARGIRVILDVVLNHSESEAPLTRIDFDYWYREDREGVPSFGPPFDYERYDETVDVMPARAFALESIEYWVQTYHIDGYRLDATAPIDNFDIVRAVRERARASSGGKPFYVVAEQLPEDPAIAGPDGPADGAWHQTFERAVVGWICGDGTDTGAVAAGLDPRTTGYARPGLVVNYVESHDEHTLMREMDRAGIGGDAAFRKHKLAATLLFTAVGLPMLYQGQEFGGFRERDMAIRPIQWELLDADFGLHLKEHYAFLARLRHERDALPGDAIEVLHVGDGELVYRRGQGDGEVLVAVNLHDDDRHLTVPFPDGSWELLIGGGEWETSGGRLDADFTASEARLFARRG